MYLYVYYEGPSGLSESPPTLLDMEHALHGQLVIFHIAEGTVFKMVSADCWHQVSPLALRSTCSNQAMHWTPE